MKKLYIGIVRDHSASMSGMVKAAMEDYNQLIQSFIEQAAEHQIDAVVSVVRCGDYTKLDNRPRGLPIGVARESVISSVNALKSLERYPATGGGTPLYDSIGDLITQFKSMPDVNNDEVQVIIFALTDGVENDSSVWRAAKLRQEIAHLKGENWTFTFRVPTGYGNRIKNELNLDIGNILEWATTSKGLAESSIRTQSATANYFAEVKSGTRSTTSFYTDLSKVKVNDVKQSMADISNDVQFWTVETDAEGRTIREYCEFKSGKPFIKGAAFYQLTKTERNVQDYKKIALRVKSTGQVYCGDAARALLGLPQSGNARVIPGDHGKFDLFVQSTSINRRLPIGTQVMYWSDIHSGPTATTAKAAIKATIKPKQPAPANNAGNRFSNLPVASSEVIETYTAGYKAGRGKKKNLTNQYPAKIQSHYAEGFADGKKKVANKYFVSV